MLFVYGTCVCLGVFLVAHVFDDVVFGYVVCVVVHVEIHESPLACSCFVCVCVCWIVRPICRRLHYASCVVRSFSNKTTVCGFVCVRVGMFVCPVAFCMCVVVLVCVSGCVIARMCLFVSLCCCVVV